jgi:hypothetical protein
MKSSMPESDNPKCQILCFAVSGLIFRDYVEGSEYKYRPVVNMSGISQFKLPLYMVS